MLCGFTERPASFCRLCTDQFFLATWQEESTPKQSPSYWLGICMSSFWWHQNEAKLCDFANGCLNCLLSKEMSHYLTTSSLEGSTAHTWKSWKLTTFVSWLEWRGFFSFTRSAGIAGFLFLSNRLVGTSSSACWSSIQSSPSLGVSGLTRQSRDLWCLKWNWNARFSEKHHGSGGWNQSDNEYFQRASLLLGSWLNVHQSYSIRRRNPYFQHYWDYCRQKGLPDLSWYSLLIPSSYCLL